MTAFVIPFGSHRVISMRVNSQIARKNTPFHVPSQHMVWDIVLQGVASIAIGMALNLPYMDKEYRGTLMIASTSDLWFLPRLFCQYHVSNCIQKNARFWGYPLCIGNRMLC